MLLLGVMIFGANTVAVLAEQNAQKQWQLKNVWVISLFKYLYKSQDYIDV